MTDSMFTELDPEYLMAKGTWKVVYQNVRTLALFETRIFEFSERSVKIKEISAAGYRIISAVRQ
jgi:hypothetical protein